MIIGETFNNEYDGYEENYDYLFKRKSKEERQQRKADNKQKRSQKKALRQEKRQEKKENKDNAPKKHPIFGNFGLFNKNKKKEKEQANTGTSSSSLGSSNSPASSGAQGSGNILNALKEKAAEINIPGSETAETEGAKMEGNTQDTGGSPKKEAGMGAVFGFVALGVVVTIIGVVLFRVDKKSNPAPQPLKVAA